MYYLKTFEQNSLFDKIKGKLKGTIKDGGMWYITSSDEFKELKRLKDYQKGKLDKEIKKYGEVYTIGGEAAQKMVDEYNNSIGLLDTTITNYLNKKINKDGVIKELDKKIKEVESQPTLGMKEPEDFKGAALNLLNWIKTDVVKYLI